jgi:hypothetical protein
VEAASDPPRGKIEAHAVAVLLWAVTLNKTARIDAEPLCAAKDFEALSGVER